MSNYVINKTDGSILVEISDGSINQSATDLTLIGRNSSNYGEFLNENLIRLLENFASPSKPNNPINGQLWYDTSDNRMKVYDVTIQDFKVSGGTIVAPNAPSGIVKGDIWIDNYRRQLYFNDGVSNLLAGPIYTDQQGISGFQTVDILDTDNLQHTVALLFVANSLIGIWSKDAFTPSTSIAGYSGSIQVGFNAGTLNGIKLHTSVAVADALTNPSTGSPLSAGSFLSTLDDSGTTGTISILNTTPLILGSLAQNEITVNNNNIQFIANQSDQDFLIKTKSGGTPNTALVIKATSKHVGIYNSNPQATLDVSGDLIVTGNFTRNGLAFIPMNYITVATSTTYILSTTNTDNVLIVTNTGLTATLTFPSSGLIDGQVLKFTVTTNTVTLALTAGSTLVGTFAGSVTAPTTFTYVYRLSNTTWYRVG
jgi:hypothetical protein